MARPPIALQRALAHLRRLAASPGSRQTGALPGVRALCRNAGVSQETMLKAVGVLCREGVLRTEPGRRILLVDVPPTAPEPADRISVPIVLSRPKWQLVANVIRSELVSGTYGVESGSTLPSANHANHRTLRKALQLLHREGYLGFARRKYSVEVPRGVRPGARVVLITRAAPQLSFQRMVPRSIELLRHLEAQCIAREVHLDLILGGYDQGLFGFVPGIAEYAHRHRSELFGFVVWTIGFSANQLSTILNEVAPLGLPVAILDEQDSMRDPSVPQLDSARIVNLAAGRTCGLDMGRYLVRLGHRRLLYLDFGPLAPWSQMRLAGVKGALEECGLADCVDCATVGPVTPSSFDQAKYVPELLAPRELPATERTDAIAAIRGIETEIWAGISASMRRPGLHAALDNCLRTHTASAWVVARDELAYECLGFLSQRGVNVPGSLSVVGFDDLPESLFRGLTSYSFGPTGVAHQLLDIALMSPAVLRRGAAPRVVEAPGRVIERTSSSRTSRT